MNIALKTEDGKTFIELDGRLDTTSAPELEHRLGDVPEDAHTVIFDFAKLRYISSAGLRVLLAIKKKLGAKQGGIIIRNANELVMEVFEATGFTDILTIENE